MCIALQLLLYFIAHYEHAKNLEISEKAATYFVSNPLQEYAVILNKTIKFGNTGWHKKNGSFRKTQQKLKKSEKKNYWQKLNHYNLHFKRQ